MSELSDCHLDVCMCARKSENIFQKEKNIEKNKSAKILNFKE